MGGPINMQPLTDAFFALITASRWCEIEPTNPLRLAALDRDMTLFKSNIETCDAMEIQYVTHTFAEEIARVHAALIQLNRRPCRIFVHKVLVKLKNDLAAKHITNLFGKFIQGISYFRSQNTHEVPMYHRLMSCGPRANADAFRKDHHVCSIHRMGNKRRVWTCYLERLVHGDIYLHEMLHDPGTNLQMDDGPLLDDGHTARNDIVRTDYRTCNPYQSITLHIEWENRIPIALHVQYMSDALTVGGPPIILATEVYRKQPVFPKDEPWRYDFIVDCRRVTRPGTRHEATYAKFQSFEREAKWERLHAEYARHSAPEKASRAPTPLTMPASA